MKTLIIFTLATVAWMSYEASATETNCALWSKGSMFILYQNHALIGHSFLNQSGTVRIECIILCFRQSRCVSFNHDDTSGICQLNDARKEEFSESYKQDGGFSYFDCLDKVAQLTEEVPSTQAATTERVSSDSTELSTQTPEEISTQPVDNEGPTLDCPKGAFGLTNDSNALTSVEWGFLSGSDNVDGNVLGSDITCRDDDEGRIVVTSDFFKVGNTSVTCTASDAAGNPGNCTFVVTVTVCGITRLGMESGAIADRQITATDVVNNDYVNYGPALARLNSNGSWCGDPATNPRIEVDFERIVDIYGLIVQSRYQPSYYVGSFALAYSNDGSQWTYLREADGGDFWIYYCQRVYDRREVLVSVRTTTQIMIRARHIHIYPWSSSGNSCLRFELLTCN